MSLIILAAGGTGGHIFPAVSLAKLLMSFGYRVVLFTDDRFNLYKSNRTNVEFFVIPIRKLHKGIVNKFKFIVSLLSSYLLALFKIKKMQPILVVGFGGYPSFPVLLAALHNKISIVLHEQNTVLGKVNRFFASYAKVLAVSFPQIFYNNFNCVFTGNPVDSEFLNLSCNFFIPTQEERLVILVVGGSQGSISITNIVSEAISMLSAEEEYKDKLYIIQQCPSSLLNIVENKYKKFGIGYEVNTFFIDMPRQLSRAHLVISRAGATTIAEVTAAARPAIYIPYPHSTGNHQFYNAQYFQEHGAALLIEEKMLAATKLKNILLEFINNRSVLSKMSENAKKLINNNSTSALANVIKDLIHLT